MSPGDSITANNMTFKTTKFKLDNDLQTFIDEFKQDKNLNTQSSKEFEERMVSSERR